MTICEKTEQFVCISCIDEVRYSFVSHLSKALRRKGINDVVIDVDSDDLLSKDSQAKLEKARVSVMVLPGNCDPSKVWLDNFVKVLECQRNKDQVVVPVLYGDSPLQGEWLSALNLGGLSPIHQSRKECSDAKLVEEIVRDVYEKLFHVGRIGIYSKLLEIENMVCKQQLDDIRCVGIWGMPGIGKTTLAEAVFDQISGEFDAYCFIKDYDKVIHENGLYRLLEEQFLKEKPGAFGNITKFSLLKNELNNKRVLVVLDDVRNPLVAEPFLGGFDWFGPKSLIIITSRDKQVLHLCEVNQIYEVQGLNDKEACQLFSSCAINYMEEQNLDELSMKVIKYANGHPLALKIYCRELKCKRKLSEMETAFLKLKRRPPFKIVDAFKSSYDTLSDSEKNIFLDIACFFQGENVDYVMQLLKGCGFFPRVGIDVLVEKHLVTISDNCVWMHNLIQDVGREIINGETVQIERRSRLWEPWSVKYLLEDNGEKENEEPKTTFKRSQGTKEIEGMFLDASNLSFDVKPAAFENMLNLRLLKIYCSNPKIHPVINFPKGSLHSLPNELRLLHWENYSLQSLPQSFDPSHLVEINMPYSQLQKLWDGTENLEMLRTIRLCHSQQLVDIGDLLKAQNLEVIELQGCTRLQSFPATGKLLHLRVVNLSGCTQLKSFPEIPPNIETLHLQGTGIKKLLILKPNGGELVSLSELKGLSDALKLERLTSLEKSSLSSQVLGKLICLNLKDCSRLQSLPNMVCLILLKVLDLSGCSELKTIKGFPRNLKQLYIAGTAVIKVPQLPQSLQLLSAHGCVSLKSVHFDFEKLPVHYTFSNCFDLSPQMVNVFLVRALSNAEHIPRERQQELKESPAFSFCAPSHAKNISKLDLKPGSSVMTRLIPSWRNTLVGFAMLVEVAFSEDYCDATGFGIRCVCKWKNKEGHSHRIERNLHCWALGKAVHKAHMFVFCDVNMRPSTDEGNDPNIWADLVVFEFFPVSKQTKPLDDCCTVTTCGVRVITAANCNTSLENISPVLSLDPMEFSGYENEEVWRDNYDDLQEMEKVLFLYIACLFNDEDVDFVAPLIASIDLDVSSGLKVLAGRSLISVSSNGEIVMHFLLRQMGKELLRTKSMLPGSSKKSERLVENSQSSMTTHSKNTENWTNNLSDVPKKKRKADHVFPFDLWGWGKYLDDYPNERDGLPTLQPSSSKETSSFLGHVLELSSCTAATTPISSGTCTSGLSQELKPQLKNSSSSKLCQVEGCQKGARGASGRCISHGGGRRCQKHGCNKGAEGRFVYCKFHGGGRRCEFLGCTKSAEGRTDLCIAHGGGRRCSHEDCTRAARGRSGLCIRHGGGKRCQRENCTKSAEGLSGLCISHGGGRRCQSNGCTKGAQGITMFCKAHCGGKRCTHSGCTKGAEGSTPFCKGHGGGEICAFQGGDPCSKSVHGGTNFCVAHGGGKRCVVPECTKSARGRTGFCVRHGGGKRCKSEGCGKSAEGSTDFCKAHGGGKQCAWGHPETEYAGESSSGPCTSFARGKTGLCALHNSLVQDGQVHGGMTITSERQEPRVSSSKSEIEDEFSGSQDMNIYTMKARSATGSPD